MSKQSIFTVNNRKRLVPDATDRAIFDYLLYHENGATQLKMNEGLNIGQPTISNRLRKIGPNPFIYNNQSYIISRIKGKYQMIRLRNLSIALNKNATAEQKLEFGEMLEEIIADFVEHKVLTDTTATIVTESVILYKVKEKYYNSIKNNLYKLYDEHIYDIVPCQQGLYIILNYKLLGKNLHLIKDSVVSLYSEVATIIERNKLSSSLFVKKEKKK